MKLIDKEKIVAEIERLRKYQRLDDRHDQGVLDGLHAIEKFIDTLEVKEVDLKQKLNDNLGNELAILSAYIISGEWSEAHISRALGIVKELEKFVEDKI